MVDIVEPVGIADIRAAARRCEGVAIRTPIVACQAPSLAPGREVHLKLESLQPVGSFKVRPIGNVVRSLAADQVAGGIYTASSGNSALGVAWMAARLGIPSTALVPDGASPAKLAPLRALGCAIETLSFEDWWQTIIARGRPGTRGLYIDAVRDPAALAGDGTIGLEIAEQLADCDAVFAPFGGGGLISGIGCAIRAIRPDIRIVACELDSAAPLTGAFEAGRPVEVPFDPGFVSGAGARAVLPEMWPLIRSVVDETITVSLGEVAAAIGTVARGNHVIMEGAGALSVAAALSGRHPYRKVCALVSGGNLDAATLVDILEGRNP